jgi:hypothetical protein
VEMPFWNFDVRNIIYKKKLKAIVLQVDYQFPYKTSKSWERKMTTLEHTSIKVFEKNTISKTIT